MHVAPFGPGWMRKQQLCRCLGGVSVHMAGQKLSLVYLVSVSDYGTAQPLIEVHGGLYKSDI